MTSRRGLTRSKGGAWNIASGNWNGPIGTISPGSEFATPIIGFVPNVVSEPINPGAFLPVDAVNVSVVDLEVDFLPNPATVYGYINPYVGVRIQEFDDAIPGFSTTYPAASYDAEQDGWLFLWSRTMFMPVPGILPGQGITAEVGTKVKRVIRKNLRISYGQQLTLYVGNGARATSQLAYCFNVRAKITRRL